MYGITVPTSQQMQPIMGAGSPPTPTYGATAATPEPALFGTQQEEEEEIISNRRAAGGEEEPGAVDPAAGGQEVVWSWIDLLGNRVGFFFVSMSLPYLLNAAFLWMLTCKLDYSASIPWYAVFLPFWGADLLTGGQKVRDICSSNIDDPPSDARAVKAVVQLIESLGQAMTKLAVFLYLTGLSALPQRFTLMAAPLILSTFIAMYLRCTRTNDSDFSILLGTSYHFVARVLQPLLVACALDGMIKQPLMVVMTPAWTVLIIFFSGALFLAYCAPVIRLHALQRLQSQAMLLVLMCCAYLLSISCCGFLFIFFLAQRLDMEAGYSSGKPISTLQILLPLIILQFILAIIQPGITIVSRRFQTMTQLYLNMQQGISDAVPRRTWLRPVRRKTWLCRSRESESTATPAHVYRSIDGAYQRLGYQTQEDLLLAIVQCSAEGAKLLSWDRFVEVASDSTTASATAAAAAAAAEIEPIIYQSSAVAESHCFEPVAAPSDVDIEMQSGICHTPSPNSMLSENEHDNCIICYCQVADACIMACGHGGICYSCASALASKPSRSCPICRQPIQQVLRLQPSFFWLRRGTVGVFSSDEGIEVCSTPIASTTTSSASSGSSRRQGIAARTTATIADPATTTASDATTNTTTAQQLEADIEAAVLRGSELDPPL